MRLMRKVGFSLDRRAALALLAGAGALVNLPALACFGARRKRCDALVAEPGDPGGKRANPAIDFGIDQMRKTLPDATRQVAPAPVTLGESPEQSVDLLRAAFERIEPLAAIVFDYLTPVEALVALADEFGTPTLLVRSARAAARCLFHLLPSQSAIVADCVAMLPSAGFTAGEVGVVAPAYGAELAGAIAAQLEKLNLKVIQSIGATGADGEATAALQRMQPLSNLVFVAPDRLVRQNAELLRTKNVLIVSEYADPGQILPQGSPPGWLLASYLSPKKLTAHPVGKALEASVQDIRAQPEPTYIVEMVFAATAWQALSGALLQAGIEQNDSEGAELEKICKALAALKIDRSALLLPWEGLSFDPATHGVVGARLAGLRRSGDAIKTVWPAAN